MHASTLSLAPSRLCPMLTAGAMLALAAPALAQSDGDARPLEEVVVEGRLTRYSATKSDTPILETARSVSIENRTQLVEKGALDLADAFVYSAGVTGDSYGFATRGDWGFVRGLEVPEYRDSLQALFGYYNNTRPDIYTIEQVEILKGPASVLYGQGSPGGIVNVVSKTPQEDAASEFVLEYGNYDRIEAAADVTGTIDDDGNWLYRLIGVYRDTDTQVDHVAEEARVLAPSLTWRPDDATNVTVLANFQQTDTDTGAQFLPISGTLRPARNARTIEPETYLGEPDFNRYDTETDSLTLLADHRLNDIWSLEATARATDGEADYHQAWPAFIGGDRYVHNADGSLYEDGTVPRTFYESAARSEQQAIDVRARAEFATGRALHEVLLGTQYQDVTTENDSAYAFALGYDGATGGPDATFGDTYWINVFDPIYGNVPPPSVMEPFFSDAPASNTTDAGLYFSDQVSIDGWRITFGLRRDDVETDTGFTLQQDDAVSTSVGALYRFDNGLSPYASYAESFEPVVGVDEITGDAFDPQEGRQYEVGLKYQPRRPSTFLTVAWFDIDQSNLSNPNSLVNAPSQQEGVTHIDGIEVEGIFTLGDFRIEGNASRVRTENPNGFRLASVPETQASTWIRYAPSALDGFVAGLGMRYVGETYDGIDSLRTPSYTLADLMLGYTASTWDVRVNARNVTDKAYQATCLARGDCFPGEQRSVVGKVAFRF